MADEKVIPDPIEQVREEMECTRASLSKKFDTLESKVAESVGETTATISAAKDSIEETVQSVQQAVHGTMSAVEDFFNVPAQVQRHPWATLCGSLVIGYVGGRLLHAPAFNAAKLADATNPIDERAPGKQNGHGKHNGHSGRRQHAKPGVFQSLAHQFESELGKIKDIALASMVSGLHQWLASSIPEAIQPQVQDIVTSVTQKLGVDGGPRVEASPSPERFNAESRRFAG